MTVKPMYGDCKPDTNSPRHCELLADEPNDNTLSTDFDSASVRDVLVVKNNSGGWYHNGSH